MAAGLRFHTEAGLLTSFVTALPFPVSQWIARPLPYTVTASLRIHTGFPFHSPFGEHLCATILYFFQTVGLYHILSNCQCVLMPDIRFYSLVRANKQAASSNGTRCRFFYPSSVFPLSAVQQRHAAAQRAQCHHGIQRHAGICGFGRCHRLRGVGHAGIALPVAGSGGVIRPDGCRMSKAFPPGTVR